MDTPSITDLGSIDYLRVRTPAVKNGYGMDVWSIICSRGFHAKMDVGYALGLGPMEEVGQTGAR
jgi:hypothetical protein